MNNIYLKSDIYYRNLYLKNNQNNYKSQKHINFCSNNDEFCTKNKSKNNIFKIFAPAAIAGLICLSGLTGCSENRVSDTENIDGTKIEYYNVTPKTRDSLAVPLLSLKSKLTKDNDFLKNVDINISGEYNDLDDNHSFKTFLKNDKDTEQEKGTSFYSDSNVKRIIVIQENAHNNIGDRLLSMNTNGKYSSMPAMRHSLMHEVGHQFDEYFGHNHNSDFAKKWDNILKEKEQNPQTNPYLFDTNSGESEIINYYNKNSGLSDSKDFKNAILKDLNNIAKIQKTNPDKTPCNIEYYAFGIDFSKPITIKDVDCAEQARTETYANLFSYAVGENDGDKEDFINAFKNSYQIVRKDIAQKIGKNVLK